MNVGLHKLSISAIRNVSVSLRCPVYATTWLEFVCKILPREIARSFKNNCWSWTRVNFLVLFWKLTCRHVYEFFLTQVYEKTKIIIKNSNSKARERNGARSIFFFVLSYF